MNIMAAMIKTHSDLIDKLGGTVAVAKLSGVGPSAVSNWRKTGIPPRLHMRLDDECKVRGIRVPKGFWSQPLGGAAGVAAE